MSEHPLLSPELLAIKTPLQRRPRQEPALTTKPEDLPPAPSPEYSIYSSTGPLAGDFYAETRQVQWHPQPRYAPAASLPPSESDALAAAIQLPHPPPMAVRSQARTYLALMACPTATTGPSHTAAVCRRGSHPRLQATTCHTWSRLWPISSPCQHRLSGRRADHQSSSITMAQRRTIRTSRTHHVFTESRHRAFVD
jgi:hypothetical protein